MASVGEMLRRERERQGLNLDSIAVETRIKRQYLEALEQDDFDRLPGRFFARSFTTQYAERLGINSPELHTELERQAAAVEVFSASASSIPDKQFTVDPLPEGTASAVTWNKLLSSIVALIAVILACGTVFWLWQRSQLKLTSANERVPQVQESVERDAARMPQTVSPPAAQPAPGATGSLSVPQSGTETTPAVIQPVSQPPAADPGTPGVSSLSNAPIRLQVTSRENTWLRITVDGKVVTERVLGPGESREVSGRESASVLLGNAGGVAIRYNGKDIGEVGPRGQVRSVEFTPADYSVVVPQKKSSADDEL